MASRVDFYRLEGQSQDRPLFTVREVEGRVVASGGKLSDAVLVLKRPVEVGERKISRQERPLDWVANLPLAYGRETFVATEPTRESTTIRDVLLSEPTLLAYKSLNEFFIFEDKQVRTQDGRAVAPQRFLRTVSGGEWEILLPYAEVLEALSPALPTPSLDELTRDFFAELDRFQREYENWQRLYKTDDVWEKVLIGTPEERIPRRVESPDRGLFGRLGQRYYPRVEAGRLLTEQLWRLPESPGSPTATIAATVSVALDSRRAEQAIIDTAHLRVKTKIFFTRAPQEQVEGVAERLRRALERAGGFVEGERYFLIFGPTAAKPRQSWHVAKVDPASGESWLLSAWNRD